ncbi:unnamed protein product [Calicophoron daubneyi]|uniref:Uncharacterized protein n=1 Tax=Calicophoron daubneyi TaxID=300641 RepID=A0AAV2T3U6_CALDB
MCRMKSNLGKSNYNVEMLLPMTVAIQLPRESPVVVMGVSGMLLTRIPGIFSILQSYLVVSEAILNQAGTYRKSASSTDYISVLMPRAMLSASKFHLELLLGKKFTEAGRNRMNNVPLNGVRVSDPRTAPPILSKNQPPRVLKAIKLESGFYHLGLTLLLRNTNFDNTAMIACCASTEG